MALSEEQLGQCLKLRLNYLNKLKPLLQHRWEINQTLRQSFGPVLGDSFSGTDLNSARVMVRSFTYSVESKFVSSFPSFQYESVLERFR